MQCSESSELDTIATVLENREVGPGCFRMRLAGRNVAASARPGQFVHVRIPSPSLDPLLRRPFSVCLTNPSGGTFLVLYQVVGRGTEMLTGLRHGDGLAVLGPLGRGFELLSDTGSTVLVAGGIGIAPLVMLSHALFTAGKQFTLLIGARSRDLLVGLDLLPAGPCPAQDGLGCGQQRRPGVPMVHRAGDGGGSRGGGPGPADSAQPEPPGRSAESMHWLVPRDSDVAPGSDYYDVRVVTEDGSVGERGLVTDVLGRLLVRGGIACIYACGPLAMLREVARLGEAHDVPVQVSLEERMACGLGACLGCAVRRRPRRGAGPKHPAYLRVCADGPVFWSSEVDLGDIS
ncbi:MAG: dihydroorotate dehydrogenase electron transfer subunit [Bacillota bacterium]